jgi:hypothetical protein
MKTIHGYNVRLRLVCLLFRLRKFRMQVVKLNQKKENSVTCKRTLYITVTQVSVIIIKYPSHVFMLINLNLKWKRNIRITWSNSEPAVSMTLSAPRKNCIPPAVFILKTKVRVLTIFIRGRLGLSFGDYIIPFLVWVFWNTRQGNNYLNSCTFQGVMLIMVGRKGHLGP